MENNYNYNQNLNREEIKINKVKGNWWYYFCKRVFDIFSSLFVILLLSWFLLILYIIQLFATRFHPIFLDKRVGYKGKEIKVYKFRTMYFDAESNIDKYLTREQFEIWKKERKLDDDPRITKFGKFLRKTSLDELPQLFNILFGSMSVVGPRPITRKEEENFFPSELEILHKAKPGLTGYWQVVARNNASFYSGERQKLELEYFTKRGFWFDLGIIFRTIPCVIGRRGVK